MSLGCHLRNWEHVGCDGLRHLKSFNKLYDISKDLESLYYVVHTHLEHLYYVVHKHLESILCCTHTSRASILYCMLRSRGSCLLFTQSPIVYKLWYTLRSRVYNVVRTILELLRRCSREVSAPLCGVRQAAMNMGRFNQPMPARGAIAAGAHASVHYNQLIPAAVTGNQRWRKQCCCSYTLSNNS